jgi:hypothetical protein
VRAENGRVTAAYNEDGFDGLGSFPNRNVFIVMRFGVVVPNFDRNESEWGIWNHPNFGPDFRDDLVISRNCHENERSHSRRMSGA